MDRAHRVPGLPGRGWWWYAVDKEGRRIGIYMVINATNGMVYGATHPPNEENRSRLVYGDFRLASTLSYMAHLRLEALLGK